MASSVGNIVVNITANIDKMQKDLKGAATEFAAFGGAVGGIAGAVATKLIDMASQGAQAFATLVASQAEAVDAAAKIADALDVNIQALRGLQYAGRLAGSSNDGVASSMQRLAKMLGEARSGNEQAAKSFAQLGVNADVLANMSIDQAFMKVSQAVSEIENPAQRAAYVMDIFGKSGQELIPMMLEGEQGLQKMQEEFNNLNGITTRLDAAKIEEMNDNFERMKIAAEGVAEKGLKLIAADLADIAEWFASIIKDSMFWVGAFLSGVKTVIGGLRSLHDSLLGIDRTLINLGKNDVANLDAAWHKMKRNAEQRAEEASWRVEADPNALTDYERKMAAEITKNSKKGDEERLKQSEKYFDEYQAAGKRAFDTLKKEADAIVESTKSPMDLWIDKAEKLNELFMLGLLTQKQVDAALLKNSRDIMTDNPAEQMNAGEFKQFDSFVNVKALSSGAQQKQKVEDKQLETTNKLLFQIVQQSMLGGDGGAVAVTTE